jgi:putative polyhydroxyalkanoate system protein
MFAPEPMIVIRRRHHLGLVNAKRLAEALARRLQNKLGGTFTWNGNELQFQRRGASGSATVTEDSVQIRVELGLLLRPLRGRIEREIRAGLDEQLGQQGAESPGRSARTAPRPSTKG